MKKKRQERKNEREGDGAQKIRPVPLIEEVKRRKFIYINIYIKKDAKAAQGALRSHRPDIWKRDDRVLA